ncbi:hypothetical protein BDR04DRAFT_1122113 [Suillus decipiens]|nr:hypothetical protein BDR04DRAFT_1122113 [Suillus decipiens]
MNLPPGGSLTADQNIFNTKLSMVRVRSEHFFSSIKGQFQSLQELCILIQSQKDLDYANMWIHLCFILHNLIVKIKEKLNHEDSDVCFYEEPWRPRQTGADTDAGEDDQREGGGAVCDQTYIGSVGQDFCNMLKTQLLSSFAQRIYIQGKNENKGSKGYQSMEFGVVKGISSEMGKLYLGEQGQ